MSLLRAPHALATTALLLAIPLGAGCGPEAEDPGSALDEYSPGPDGSDRPEGAGGGIGGPVGDLAAPDGPASLRPMPEQAEPVADEDLEAMTAEELVGRSRMVFALDEKIRLLDAAVEKAPDSRAALLGLIDAVERKGIQLALTEGGRDRSKPFLYRAAELTRRLREMGQPIEGQERSFAAMVFYNEACNFALDGEPERAMESLREAVAMDFSDPIIYTDEELDPLRARDDFKALLGEIPEPAPASPGPPSTLPEPAPAGP